MQHTRNRSEDCILDMGTFVSFPEAFPTADVRIVDGLKFQVKFHKSLSKENAIKFDAVFDASRMLLDFDAVDVSAVYGDCFNICK